MTMLLMVQALVLVLFLVLSTANGGSNSHHHHHQSSFSASAPPRPGGVVYNPSAKPYPLVRLEAFFDLLCPDCKAIWPVLKTVAHHYKPEWVELRVHLFPLPYHRNAFLASQGALVVQANSGDSGFFNWVDLMFATQDSLWDGPTANMTTLQVLDLLTKYAGHVNVPAAVFEKGMRRDDPLHIQTRLAWKYGCSRGVFGTPWVLLNGMAFDTDSVNSPEDWYKVIDPLIYSSLPASNGGPKATPASAPSKRTHPVQPL